MNFLQAIGCTVLLGALSAANAWATPANAEQPKLSIGMITYWGPDPEAYDIIPDHSLAVINPDNGALKSRGQKVTLAKNMDAYRNIVARAKQRKIAMLGYVPTGYFNHSCNAIGKCQTWDRIERQVAAYFEEIPDVAGIFFDEAAPSEWSCASFVEEYARLRAIVRTHSKNALMAFNAGVPDNCVIGGTQAGEIAVLFEGSPENYLDEGERLKQSAASARDKGVKIWHLVHTVASNEQIAELVSTSQAYGTDLFYVTLNSGDWESGVNTWGR